MNESYDFIPDSPLSTSSTLILDDDHIRSIFLAEKQLVDHQWPIDESELPPSVMACLSDILDQPDIYDAVFGSQSDLNPSAQPFVPKCQIAQAQEPLVPLWEAVFSAACTHHRPTMPILSDYATELVAVGLWDPHGLIKLAKRFCSQASSPASDANRDALAPFAKEIYIRFQNTLGKETANYFLANLRDTAVEIFRNSWCTPVSPKAISYDNVPSADYLASATYITRFIGDMYAHDLYPKTQICICISILMHEMYSVEHLEVLRVLLTHAGAALWCVVDDEQLFPIEAMIRRFLEHFAGKVIAMKQRKQLSVMGRTCTDSRELDGKIRAILDMLSRWLGRDDRQL
ncbi:hypothetical protein WG66_014469 [Moniliophthora roreri]|uniref:Uncharacterized protein n=1 Tax=Moniliophthora roreri TaxID=221103 RepID=A0A0W0FIN5_MONRR|nr:hypothetical protein WG66_014469 [Moniliophthora roreri]